MNQEIWVLAASVVLGLVQIGLASATQRRQRGRDWYVGARDQPMPPLTGMAGRMERAFKNYSETFPLFAAAVLTTQLAETQGWLTIAGAHFYFWGRVAYVPFYAFGPPVLRSLSWNLATLGIALILIGLML